MLSGKAGTGLSWQHFKIIGREKKLMFKNTGLDEKLNKRFYLIYSVIFVFLTVGVFFVYLISKRTFIWGLDGYEQHIKALIYYADYLKEFFHNLFVNHEFLVKQWDFSIGEGSDVLGTFHYYVMGDPFAFFCFLFPAKYMFIFYGLMVILRMYFAGLTFSAFCIYMGHSKCFVLPGTLCYAFSYWAMYNAVRHPFFLNPLIYFPLLILGVEKIIRKERPYVFIGAVFVSAISNFYFFYMLVLSVVLYVVVRLIFLYRKDIKQWLTTIGKLLYTSVIGVMLSGVIFVPMLYFFSSDTRFESSNALRLVYPFSYYLKLPGLFTIEGDTFWTCMGFAMPVFFAVILLFLKKKNNTILKAFFIICVIMALIPAFGQAFNGFSYMCNRWTFAFAMLMSYILVVMCDELVNLDKKTTKLLKVALFAYFVVCMLIKYSRNLKLVCVTLIALVCLILLVKLKSREGRIVAITLAVILSTLSNSFWKYSSLGDNYAEECITVDEALDITNTETKLVSEVIKIDKDYSDNDFVRYSGSELVYNASCLEGLSSTGLYWTLTNTFVSSFRKTMGLPLETLLPHKFMGYDQRSVLLALSSVKYYVAPDDDDNIPYSFKYVKSADNLKIYENENALPLGYTYDKAINHDEWEKLSLQKKQESLLHAIVLNSDNIESEDYVNISQIDYDGRDVSYEIVNNPKEVYCDDNSFVVMKPGSSVTLNFEGINDTETYLSITGLEYDGTAEFMLYYGPSKYDPKDSYSKEDFNKLPINEKTRIFSNFVYWTQSTDKVNLNFKTANTEKNAYYFTSDYSYYSNQHDFSINLGYNKDSLKSITITFEKIGIYSFDSLEINEYKMMDLDKKLDELREESLTDVSINGNKVNGSINVSDDKYLLISIPYSKGWSAYVDGEKTKIFQANGQYLGIELSKGEHEIKLVYNTPLFKAGAFVSLLGVLLFILCIILFEKKVVVCTEKLQN